MTQTTTNTPTPNPELIKLQRREMIEHIRRSTGITVPIDLPDNDLTLMWMDL